MNPLELAAQPLKQNAYQVTLPPVKAPQSEVKGGVLGFLKDIFKGGDETAGGVLRNTIKGLPKAAVDVGKDILRAPGREAASLVISGQGRDELTPATKAEKFLYGDEPVKSVGKRSKEASESLETFGISPKISGALGPLAVGGSIGLNLYPGSAGKAGLVKELAKESTEAGVKALLREGVEGIADDVVERIAPAIAKETKIDEVTRILESSLPKEKSLLDLTPPGVSSSKDKVTSAERLTRAIKEASMARPELESAQRVERSRRFGVASEAQQNVGGEEGYYAALSRLKGKLVDNPPAFQSPRDTLTPDEVKDLFTTVQGHPILSFGQQLSAQDGLLRLLQGHIPEPNQLSLLEEVFGSDLIRAVRDKRTLPKKIWDNVVDVLNIPRSIVTSMDASAVLRQGAPLLGTYPKVAGGKALAALPKQAFSEKAFNDFLDATYKSPEYKDMFQAGLYIADPRKVAGGLSAREEGFMSNLIENVPILGEIPKASSRAYSGFLNKLRIDTFKYEAKLLKERGQATQENLKALADFVNTASGRGSLGRLGRIAPELNALFFSPRFNASRLQMMGNLVNPSTYTKLPPSVRKASIQTMLTFTAELLTLAGLAKLGGMEVETDPRSADFLKMKFDNEGGIKGAAQSGIPAFFGAGASSYDDQTRLDFAAGFQPWIRLFATILTGETKSSSTGKVSELDPEKFGGRTRLDVLEDFARTKLAPVPGAIANILAGKDVVGDPADLKSEAARNIMPLYFQDIKDAFESSGGGGIGFGDTAGGGTSLPDLPTLPSLPPLGELPSLK